LSEFSIPYNSFLFRLIPKDLIILPPYKGSTFRGGFGYAFKRIVCAIKNKECIECLLKEKCIYSYVFETSPPAGTKVMRKYSSAPHPFVIEPPPEKRRSYKPGDTLQFRLILIGRAIDYLPYFIYTFEELGNIGIGKGKAHYELAEVFCEEKSIYNSISKTLHPSQSSSLSLFPNISSQESKESQNDTVTLSFLTPTRMLYNSNLTIALEFHIFIRNLVRRLALISYFHVNADPSAWDFKGIIKQAEEVKVKDKNLKWHDWERYSGRQETRMKMGGFVGKITFEGDITPFMPFIKAGEILHAGKGTSFGLGKYQIE
jgi:CRISPR-associated endoribonuclease Cas6